MNQLPLFPVWWCHACRRDDRHDDACPFYVGMLTRWRDAMTLARKKKGQRAA